MSKHKQGLKYSDACPPTASLPPLTPRQQQVLDIITASLRHTSVFPSLREIARKLGVKSPSGVAGHLKALANKGYLARAEEPLQTSGFVLPSSSPLGESVRQEGKPAEPVSGFPLVAQIAAGSPHISAEAAGHRPPETLVFSYDYFGGGELKAMTVEGQSMLGDAIDDGDIVIIDTRQSSMSGFQLGSISPSRIVAVRVLGGEFSLKRLGFVGDQIQLIPSNPDYHSRMYPKDQVEILGIMVGLVRRF